MALKLESRRYPREDEVVGYDNGIIEALNKLDEGEVVWVSPRKLSLLIRRYGKGVVVEPIFWKGKTVYRVVKAHGAT
ncbi:MAG: hypothetical protein ACTSWP_01265 [Candidatus Freyarchaeota archaeon]|nr:hypothetical protein [Candidatus Freyrarchaeum guaymaensis]